MEQKLLRSFFGRPAREVARDLLGRRLVHVTKEGTLVGIVVETEAYGGPDDPASHASGGRRTGRNEVMWGPPGFAYIYSIYGMYLCFNVVCGPVGAPQGVLLRAVRPTEGQGLMAVRRGFPILNERTERQLCNGPSKLCQAFGLTLSLNGADVCGEDLCFTAGVDPGEVVASRRIGIEHAGPAREWPWRFLVRGDPFISRKA